MPYHINSNSLIYGFKYPLLSSVLTNFKICSNYLLSYAFESVSYITYTRNVYIYEINLIQRHSYIVAKVGQKNRIKQ